MRFIILLFRRQFHVWLFFWIWSIFPADQNESYKVPTQPLIGWAILAHVQSFNHRQRMCFLPTLTPLTMCLKQHIHIKRLKTTWDQRALLRWLRSILSFDRSSYRIRQPSWIVFWCDGTHAALFFRSFVWLNFPCCKRVLVCTRPVASWVAPKSKHKRINPNLLL